MWFLALVGPVVPWAVGTSIAASSFPPKENSEHPRTCIFSISALRETREQILANHCSDRWHLWRSAPGLHLPTHGGLWVSIFWTEKGLLLVLPPWVQRTDLMPPSGAFDKQGYFFPCPWLKQEVYMLYILVIFQGNVNTAWWVVATRCKAVAVPVALIGSHLVL